jgi:hypothetical protein
MSRRPIEREQPIELMERWQAWRWRRSRDLEVVAQAVWLIRAMLADKPDAEKIVLNLQGYEPEREG